TPTCQPMAVGDYVVYRNAGVLRAVDLETGRPALGPSGELHRITAPPAPQQQPERLAQQRLRLLARGFAPIDGRPPDSEPVTVSGDRLFARVGQLQTRGTAGGPMVRSFDLGREGLEAPAVSPTSPPWRLAGAPTPGRTRLYVPLVASEAASRVALAAFSMATGRELWRTSIATGGTAATATPTPTPPIAATLAGDTLYVNTNVGAVAALDTKTGGLRWVRLYDRSASTAFTAVEPTTPDAAACVVAGDRILTAPNDAESVFALDAATGRLMWASGPIAGRRRLLGVAGKTLVVGGDQVRGLDLDTGRPRYTWPETRKAGIRGMGNGCLVAGEVFWPTRDRLLVLDAATGGQTRPPIDIGNLGGAGANVAPAGDRLIVAGLKAMTLLGPEDREQKNNQPLLSQLSLKPQMHTDAHR
ncbi:MAG: PQQ-binding-like beta-propeller repeat protein, partial [Planctomycetota bacterium]